MTKLFDVYVDITDTIAVKGKLHDICMLSFTGEAAGRYFNGNECRCFIENKGSFDEGFIPVIVTDSPALSEFEGAELKAEITAEENRVIVSIFG